MNAPPPQHLRQLEESRARGFGGLAWLLTFLVATAALFFSLGDSINALQAEHGQGRYYPKMTAMVCMLLALAPAHVAYRLVVSAMQRRAR